MACAAPPPREFLTGGFFFPTADRVVFLPSPDCREAQEAHPPKHGAKERRVHRRWQQARVRGLILLRTFQYRAARAAASAGDIRSPPICACGKTRFNAASSCISKNTRSEERRVGKECRTR